jgi:hypothetical protein
MQAYNLFENSYIEVSWNFKRQWLAVYSIAKSSS